MIIHTILWRKKLISFLQLFLVLATFTAVHHLQKWIYFFFIRYCCVNYLCWRYHLVPHKNIEQQITIRHYLNFNKDWSYDCLLLRCWNVIWMKRNNTKHSNYKNNFDVEPWPEFVTFFSGDCEYSVADLPAVSKPICVFIFNRSWSNNHGIPRNEQPMA